MLNLFRTWLRVWYGPPKIKLLTMEHNSNWSRICRLKQNFYIMSFVFDCSKHYIELVQSSFYQTSSKVIFSATLNIIKQKSCLITKRWYVLHQENKIWMYRMHEFAHVRAFRSFIVSNGVKIPKSTCYRLLPFHQVNVLLCSVP